MSEISEFNTGTGIYSFKDAAARQSLAGKQNTLTFDSSPTSGSTNPVTSGGVFSSLAGKVTGQGINLSVTDEGLLRVTYNDGN